MIDKYPSGAKVEVLYDPADPGTAVLETSRSIGGIILFAFGLFWLVLGAAVVTISFTAS